MNGTAAAPVHCSKGRMHFNIAGQALTALLGAASLAEKPRRLALYALGNILNLTVFRLNTCMNCDYYGKDCHLGWGRLTARLFPHRREPDKEAFRRRFPFNFAWFVLLLLFPLPSMGKKKRLLRAYLATLSVTNLSILASCRNCSMKTACPLGERIG